MAGRMVVGGLWWWAVAGGGGRDVGCPRAARRERRRVAAGGGGWRRVSACVALLFVRIALRWPAALRIPYSVSYTCYTTYYILSHTSSTVRFLVAFDFDTRFLNMVPRRKAAVESSGAPACHWDSELSRRECRDACMHDRASATLLPLRFCLTRRARAAAHSTCPSGPSKQNELPCPAPPFCLSAHTPPRSHPPRATSAATSAPFCCSECHFRAASFRSGLRTRVRRQL